MLCRTLKTDMILYVTLIETQKRILKKKLCDYARTII